VDELTFILDPGPDGFDGLLASAREAGEKMLGDVGRVANDTAGIMAQVVTKDTWALAEHMRVMSSSTEGDKTSYEIGSDALNRSGREYAIFEHWRHEGESFFDRGEQYANDMLYEGAAKIVNSIN
jgi:hypothetical protein